jgi:crossover junction endodeoxyribonuclease RuvC
MASMTLTLPAVNSSLAAIKISPADSGVILALDLGTTTGWALLSREGVATSGTASFRPTRYDGGGMRFLRFRNWLEQIRAYAGRVEAVYFEEVRAHAGTDAAHIYGGFLATLTAWCEQQIVPYQGVPVGVIKRFIAGRGNAGKDAVMEAVRERGFHPADDNEADAIAILLWAIDTNGGLL